MKKRQREKLQKKRLAAVIVPPQSSQPTVEEFRTLATEVWRLKKALTTVSSVPNANTFTISIERLEDALRSLKLEIHDPLGEAYDEGMTLSVSLFEKTRALPQGVKRIAETISPTVYWNGQLLQVGKVIVEIGEAGGVNNGQKHD
jgi:hypothetical protein